MINNILAIGINAYRNVSQLNNCIRDMDNMLDLLTDKYDFDKTHVKRLFDSDATQENIFFQLEEYFAKQNSGENLIILFSGHGEFDVKLDLGYFLPVECILDNKSSYIPNTSLFNYIKAFEYRHVVLISDTCFSGSLFSQYRGIASANERLYEIPSRWALTSGRIEKVSDGIPGNNSPFAESIIKNLKGNTNSFFSISELTRSVISDVANTNQQIPRGSALQMLGDKGGEFVFKLKAPSKAIKGIKEADNVDNEKEGLKNLFKEYYTTYQKVEEAENENKSATSRRLNEELEFIGNVINRELVKLLQLEKTRVLSSNRIKSILGDNIEEKYIELRSISEEKNKAVKLQRFTEAADLRDKEHKLQNEFLDLIVSKKVEIQNNISSTENSLKEDFALLSIFSDMAPSRNRQETIKTLEESFTAMLFLKLSNEFEYISNFRFVNGFENFKSKTIPVILDKIANPKIESEKSMQASTRFDYSNLMKEFIKNMGKD